MTQRVLDYSIDLPCEPKRKLGTERLLDRLRQLTELPGTVRASPSEAQEAGFELRPLAFHCRRCPASLSHEAFGCFGSINLPLSVAVEEWWVSCLPKRLDERDAAGDPQVRATLALLDWWRERETPPQAFRGHRLVRGTFQLARALGKGYGPPWRRASVDTDMVYHLLLAPDRVDPGIAELVCRALGLWSDGPPGPEGVCPVVFTQPPDREDLPEISEMKRFMIALIVACSLDRPVLIRHSQFEL